MTLAPAPQGGAALEPGPDGHPVGRDPREMTIAELEALGHVKRPILAAIRAKCLDCCCGQPSEVRKCTAVGCLLWPYRMNDNPFHVRAAPSPAAGMPPAAENPGKEGGFSAAGTSASGEE